MTDPDFDAAPRTLEQAFGPGARLDTRARRPRRLLRLVLLGLFLAITYGVACIFIT